MSLKPLALSGRTKEIFEKYYIPGTPLYNTVATHSGLVAALALEIAHKRKLDVDREFLAEAALLHDIGVVRCYAPEIHCHGNMSYLRHGVVGRAMLESEGLPRHAMVCEHHTGSGITREQIERQKLPLPRRDMLPETLEERLICYADKFFSKSGDISHKKSIAAVSASMGRFGDDALARFHALYEEFEG